MRHTKLFRRLSALALAAALALSLCSCTAAAVRPVGASLAEENGLWSRLWGRDITGDHTGGGAVLTETVRNLDIAWISGEVELQTHEGNTVEFSETANRELNETTTLRYTLEGDTLRIQFCEERRRYNGDMDDLQKRLTVYLPKSVTLDGAEIDAVAANVSVNGVSMRDLAIETVAGEVELKNTAVQEELSIGTVAGDVAAGETGARKVTIGTVAGNVELDYAKVPEELEVTAVSGNVELTLPRNAQFRLEAYSSLGRTSSDFNAEGVHGSYVIGSAQKSNGTIGTMAGSVKVNAAG